MTALSPSVTPPKRWQVTFVLTDACNMRCSYCTTAKRDVTISSSHLGKVVELLEKTSPAALDLNFHGGEPTLAWEQVVELSDRLEPLLPHRTISRNMSTNGRLMTAERASFLAERGFNVRVSIDGRQEGHVRYRRGLAPRDTVAAERSYEESLRGLDILVTAGARVAVNMVVTPDNAHDLVKNVAFLVRRGLVQLTVSPVVGMVWDNDALVELDRQLNLLPAFWEHWIGEHPEIAVDVRRSLESEVRRAAYCEGDLPNQPDARLLIVGADGRLYGDEPEVRTERHLQIGHLDDCEDLATLPLSERTAFQLMYDLGFYNEEKLLSVRRTHRLLRLRTAAMLEQLFGSGSQPPASVP